MSEPGRLDDDIVRAITAAQRPLSEADDASLGRVRARLMKRIAADSVQHHTSIHADDGNWHALLPGIERKVLHEEGGVMSYLLKFAPGAVLPAHRHPVDEECVVVSGVLRIGPLVLPAGSYHRVRKDVLDADSTSDEGAVIFLRGATPRAEQLV
ncbi:MAG: cupin domain-containing protein [Burkholderiales bacterium]|nr:cupin domain-containing protein [Burkholderiales bacterium]